MENSTEFGIYHRFAEKSLRLYNISIEKIARKCGISKKEADILIYLNDNSLNATISDIAKSTGVSPEYILEAVNQMQEAGLVLLKTGGCLSDGQVSISGKGGIIAKALSGGRIKFINLITKDICQEEKSQLFNVLAKIANNIDGI